MFDRHRLHYCLSGRWDRRASMAGTATVELALVAPLLLILLMGIVEFGLLFEDYIILRNAAREGARSGAVGTDTATIAGQIAEAAAQLEQDSLTITQERATYSGDSWNWQALGDETTAQGLVNDAPSGSYIRISLTYLHRLVAASLLPELEDEPGSGTISITANAVFRRE